MNNFNKLQTFALFNVVPTPVMYKDRYQLDKEREAFYYMNDKIRKKYRYYVRNVCQSLNYCYELMEQFQQQKSEYDEINGKFDANSRKTYYFEIQQHQIEVRSMFKSIESSDTSCIPCAEY